MLCHERVVLDRFGQHRKACVVKMSTFWAKKGLLKLHGTRYACGTGTCVHCKSTTLRLTEILKQPGAVACMMRRLHLPLRFRSQQARIHPLLPPTCRPKPAGNQSMTPHSPECWNPFQFTQASRVVSQSNRVRHKGPSCSAGAME